MVRIVGFVLVRLICEMGKMYDQLEETFKRSNVRAVVDSAFLATNVEYLIKAKDISHAESAQDTILWKEATSVRQLSEWGMRGLQGSFPRLKDKLVYEERGERLIIIKLIAHLYNIRSNLVGINQILNVYMPNLREKINDDLFHH